MPRVLVRKAQEWLADMPPYYADDPYVQGVVNALATEYQRIETAAWQVLSGAFPQRFVDEDSPLYEPSQSDYYRMLALWELQLKLPVEPQGASVEQRRQAILAHIGRRRASSEEEWATALRNALGTNLWSYTVENGVVTIRMPFEETSFTAGQVVDLARAITPAHLDVNFGYEEGFILDTSPLDTGAF